VDPWRVLVDVNAFDELAVDELVHDAVSEQRLAVCVTRQIEAEAFDPRIPEEVRRRRTTLPYTLIGTGMFVLDHGVIDADRIGTDEANDAFASVQIGNEAHDVDGMLAATAKRDALPVVTSDGRLRRRCADLELEVLYPSEVVDRLR